MALASGTKLGPYEVVSILGEGGMGQVYRARDTRLSRDVAIKVLLGGVAHDAERRERFEREAQAIAALNHPNIVTIYGVEQKADTGFIVMELVEGKPLSDAVPRGGMPLGQLLKIAIPVADAVAAAHQKGITHRDLKPANIMIGSGEHDGRVKVLDFGLAKLASTAPSGETATVMPTALATGEGRILGTVAYMSPEQAEGKSIDARSDLFSLGVILYELATGDRPFTGDTSISIISAIVKDTPKSLTEINPAMPRDLARIVRRALAKDPEKRYQTAKDLRNDLEELKASLDSGELTAESTRVGVAPPSGRTHIWRWAAIGAGVVAIGALATLVIERRGAPSTPASSAAAPIKMTALTSTGNAQLAQISPDGKYVAYVLNENGQYSGWVRQLASGSTVRIIEPAPNLRGLTIAPDGSFVDFLRSQPTAAGTTLDLWRVPFLGGPARKILDDVASAPAWSPDGGQMAYVTSDAAAIRLMVAKADGSEPRVISNRTRPLRYASNTQAVRPDVRPVWLPDGRAIVVMAQGGKDGFQLVSVDIASGAETELRRLVGTLHASQGMALSRDGQSIRLTSNESGTAQVVTLGLRGGDATALTNDVATYGGVSAAGDAIVTTRSQTTAGLWLVDAAGRNARQIGRDLSTSLGSLSWAGSARLMYGAAMAGGVGLWSTEIGSGTPDLVVPGRGQGGWSASMSADGRTLVFTRSGGIWRADADGRNAARIADGGPAEITPDGSQVFYISSQSGTQSVWVVDLHGGQPRQFSTLPATGIPTVSPAGRLLMFISGESAVIMPVGGGEPVRKIPMRSTRLRWTPDGRGLTYADVTSTNLWVQPIDGGAPHQLTTFADGKTISSFAWSPDGKQLAIARAVTTSDIVLLKGVR